MNWRKLFLITYWLRGKDVATFNVLTFLLDIYIIFGILTIAIYQLLKLL